jgi:hypothetical protein
MKENFEERLQEIDSYLDLLGALDGEVQSGRLPAIGATQITVRQQRILYSAVYLQLYNLVEATVTWCIDAVCQASSAESKWSAADLSAQLRREWIRLTARTHTVLTNENRLAFAVEACESIIQAIPVAWPKDMERKGNWDDNDISALCSKLGCKLWLSEGSTRGVKEPIRDDKGPLRLVKDLRNRLAHGSISFEECGTGVTVLDLRDTKEKTVAYLRDVIASYVLHIGERRFLSDAQRLAQGFKP